MSHVEDISVTATLSSGEQHTLTAHRPGPQGDNPRYIAQQLMAGMARLTRRIDRVADLYGDQIRLDLGVDAVDAWEQGWAAAVRRDTSGNPYTTKATS